MTDARALEQQLKSKMSDSERLDLLDRIAGIYYDEDEYEKAIEFYEKAEKIAPKGNNRAYFLGQKAICQYLLHKDDQAASQLLEARKMFEPGKADFVAEVYGLVLSFLGSLHEYRGETKASLEARLEGLKYLGELPPDAQWMLLQGIGRNYDELGDNHLAIEYSNQALSLISGQDPEVAYLYESLAMNHYELGEFEKSLEYFGKVLEIDPNFERKDEVYFSIGLCYQRLMDYKMAVDSYLKILELKKLTGNKEQHGWLYTELAHCYYQLKEHHKSLEYVYKALEAPVQDRNELAEIRSYLTNNYHALGRHKESVEEGEKTLKISDNFNNIEIMLANLALSCYQLNLKDKFKYYRDWSNRAFPDRGWTRQLNKLTV